MGNTKRTLGEKIYYEVNTVEPRLSFSPELISKDLAKASEVTEVKFPRVPCISTIIVRFFSYSHSNSSGELVRKTSKFISPITNKIAN